jgi:hypothetical protein
MTWPQNAHSYVPSWSYGHSGIRRSYGEPEGCHFRLGRRRCRASRSLILFARSSTLLSPQPALEEARGSECRNHAWLRHCEPCRSLRVAVTSCGVPLCRTRGTDSRGAGSATRTSKCSLDTADRPGRGPARSARSRDTPTAWECSRSTAWTEFALDEHRHSPAERAACCPSSRKAGALEPARLHQAVSRQARPAQSSGLTA